jgi:hypothetical protein
MGTDKMIATGSLIAFGNRNQKLVYVLISVSSKLLFRIASEGYIVKNDRVLREDNFIERAVWSP